MAEKPTSLSWHLCPKNRLFTDSCWTTCSRTSCFKGNHQQKLSLNWDSLRAESEMTQSSMQWEQLLGIITSSATLSYIIPSHWIPHTPAQQTTALLSQAKLFPCQSQRGLLDGFPFLSALLQKLFSFKLACLHSEKDLIIKTRTKTIAANFYLFL